MFREAEYVLKKLPTEADATQVGGRGEGDRPVSLSACARIGRGKGSVGLLFAGGAALRWPCCEAPCA
jgi:hypothetical protein